MRLPESMRETQPAQDCVSCKAKNLRAFRSFLRLSQKEFIEKYFTDGDTRLISVSKLSMAENGTLSDIDRVIERVAALSFLPKEQFDLPTDKFTKYLYRFTGEMPNGRADVHLHQHTYIETVVKLVSDYLSENILYGRLRPGDKLPPERELAKLFHIKRPVLRDAVKVLTVLGMLDVRVGDGTYISCTTTDFYMIPLSWNLLLGPKSGTEVIELRFLLDGEAAYLAAKNASAEDLLEVNRVFLQMQAALDALDLQKYLDLDIDFHLAIAQAAKNQVILNMLPTVHRMMRSFSAGGMVFQNDILHTHNGHLKILNAILDRDADLARRALDEHRDEALERYQRNRQAGFC